MPNMRLFHVHIFFFICSYIHNTQSKKTEYARPAPLFSKPPLYPKRRRKEESRKEEKGRNYLTRVEEDEGVSVRRLDGLSFIGPCGGSQ
jgi:hypothetical protein